MFPWIFIPKANDCRHKLYAVGGSRVAAVKIMLGQRSDHSVAT